MRMACSLISWRREKRQDLRRNGWRGRFETCRFHDKGQLAVEIWNVATIGSNTMTLVRVARTCTGCGGLNPKGF